MTGTMEDVADIACIELVELVTEYLDVGLTDADRIRFERHVGVCPGCAEIVEQFRAVIVTTGALRTADALAVPPATREQLLGIFRDWRVARG
jgi:anti-sigma factor RsiW